MSQELTDKISALENILARERQARKQAEHLLESYTREVYQSNLQLKEQTREAKAKQKQLAFLTGVSAETWEKETIRDIITNYLSRGCDFLYYADGVFVQIEAGNNLSDVQIVQAQDGIINDAPAPTLSQIKQLFSQFDQTKLIIEFKNNQEGQLIQLTELTECSTELNYSFAYFVPLYSHLHDNQLQLGLACFLFHDEKHIDINKLQTIESSRATLAVALERKSAEQTLQLQLIQLEQANQTLEQTQQQLIETEKLASLGMLSAGIAHEINNPVGYVKSNLESMSDYLMTLTEILEPLNTNSTNSSLDDKADKISIKQLQQAWQNEEGHFLLEDSQDILTSSLSGLTRIQDIVSALGVFSRMDNHELEPTDVNNVIELALKMVSNELKYDYEIETDLQADKQILGSSGQLQQVFINLFVNAKHAMPKGGTLSVKTYRDKARIRVSVKDTGCGIAKEKLKNVFNPFFTTKPPGEGTGLGLSISYSILQQHHAKVEVKSEQGIGTEFLLSFFVFE